MKHILSAIPLLLLLTTLASCGRAQEETVDLNDPVALQETLKTKKTALRELTSEVKQLETKLYELRPELKPKGTLVAYQPVKTQDFENYAEVQATVVASESAVASPQIPGRILSMKFEEGDLIRKGQLVAVLDVEDISSQRAEIETSLSLAKDVFERQQRLWDQNIGSEVQFLQAKNNYERLQKSLETIDVQTAKKNVYAPISGTVDRVFQRQGETAAPGAPIISILNTNNLDVVADAGEELLTKVKRGQRLTVRVPALELEFQAPITRIGKTVDPANRTFEVELQVPARYRRQLKANLLAVVEVLEYAAQDQLVVSQDVIQQEVDGRRYVFVVAEGGEAGPTAEKRYVETGDTYDNQAIITSGLQAGDRIVTDGSRGLTDGQSIALSQNPIQ